MSTLVPGAGATPATACTDEHWVNSAMWAPSDALSIVDASLAPIVTVRNQTFRSILTPHLGGTEVRFRLTNRFRPRPLEIGRVTVGTQGRGAAVDGAVIGLTFGGSPSVTIAPDSEVLSDPVAWVVEPFRSLAVSTYVPGDASFLTGHWTANERSYYTPADVGDMTDDTAGEQFTLSTSSGLVVSAVDVLAPSTTSSVVVFGDSITDGFVAGWAVSVPQDPTAVDADGRYPDNLQRRIDSAGLPLSVSNSGMSSNKLTQPGLVPPLGPSGVSRFDTDVLAVAGVRDVIVLEGINDLGIPPWARAEDIIAAYVDLVGRAHAAGVRIHLGTILPASNAVPNGITAPFANAARIRVNEWIRSQTIADSVVDFDAALRDRSNPDVLDPRYAGVDDLHPSPAGYRAMADAVDLAVLGDRGCPR